MAAGEVADWRPETGPTARELQRLDREVPTLLREFTVIQMALTDPCPLLRPQRRNPDPTTGQTPADS